MPLRTWARKARSEHPRLLFLISPSSHGPCSGPASGAGLLPDARSPASVLLRAHDIPSSSRRMYAFRRSSFITAIASQMFSRRITPFGGSRYLCSGCQALAALTLHPSPNDPEGVQMVCGNIRCSCKAPFRTFMKIRISGRSTC